MSISFRPRNLSWTALTVRRLSLVCQRGVHEALSKLNRSLVADLKSNLNTYLENLAESQVRSLEDLISYNLQYADKELPPTHPRQDVFIKAQNQDTSSSTYERHLQHLRHVDRDRGIEWTLQTYGVDVILRPTDSGLMSMVTAGGKHWSKRE